VIGERFGEGVTRMTGAPNQNVFQFTHGVANRRLKVKK